MRKSVLILVSVFVLAFIFAGCAPGEPTESPSAPNGQDPNAWVVQEEAPVLDGTGAAVGRAYPGFAVTLENEEEGNAAFTVSNLDETGQNVQEEKQFFIDTKYMQEQYVEPKAVILMISEDMIKLNPGASLYSEAGDKLITFDGGIGPIFYIQKTDQGYMFTLDFNVVYAEEGDVTRV
jgi:hypothetical protein